MENVTTVKVLNQEELQILRKIQQNTQNIVMELGEIELISFQLEERKLKAKSNLLEISKDEQQFTSTIFEKYGEGTLNPNTGVITPNL